MGTRPTTQEPTSSGGVSLVVRGAARITGLVWGVWGVCVVFLASAWALGYLLPKELREQPTYMTTVFGVLQLVYPTVGAFVVSRRPDNAIGWLFCGVGLVTSVQCFADSYATYALSAYPEPSTGTGVVAWLSQWVAFPVIMPVGAVLFLVFPDGRLPSQRWRVVVWVAAAGGVLLAMGDALMPGPLYLHPDVNNPFGVDGSIGWVPARRMWEACALVGIVLLLGSCLVSAVALVLRLRRAGRVERQQIKWFASAAVLMVVGFTVAFWTQWGGVNNVAYFAGLFGFLMLPVAAAIAILRYRLWDIDLIVRRALVYGLLTAAVVGVYALSVGALGALFQASGGLLVSLLATGLVAVAFQPMRAGLQRGVNRLLYGERDDPYAVLSRLGRRLEDTLAPEEAIKTVAQMVAQALKLPYAAIKLGRDGVWETVAEHGTPTPEPFVLPLRSGAETVGQIVLAPRAPGEALTRADLRLLEDLARQVGIAARAVRLTADLKRSRERLVAAREEERRRLRRDLHDGLGPQLAALALKLDAARNLMPHEPEAAGALLLELKAQTKDTVSEVRRLVYDLRPSALDDLGLVLAVREQAARYGPAFSVETPDEPPPLPAAVEVAAYRISLEAMTNAARHSRARRCRVRILADERELRLEVSDDGVGMDAHHRPGVGLSSMRERAAEIGGTLAVESAPGRGTRVVARLPLPGSGVL